MHLDHLQGCPGIWFVDVENGGMLMMIGTNISFRGTYEAILIAQSNGGDCVVSHWNFTVVPEDTSEQDKKDQELKKSKNTVLILFLILVVIAVMALVRKHRRYVVSMRPKDFKEVLAGMDAQLPASCLVDKKVPREIIRSHVDLAAEIGAGQFGCVYRHFFSGPFSYHVCFVCVLQSFDHRCV